MGVKLANNARSTLAQAIDQETDKIRVKAGDGVRFPPLTDAGDWSPIVLEDSSGRVEYMRATARSGDTFTVLRAREGSAPRSYSVGAAVELRLTVEALAEFGGSGVALSISIDDYTVYI